MNSLKAAVLATALVTGFCLAGGVSAGDAVRTYRFSTLMEDPAFVARLPEGVKYYFGDEPVTVKSQIGPTGSNRKRPTPARKTPISVACQRAAGDGLIAMGLNAKAKGGNAVIGIRSNLKGALNPRGDRFDCGVGMQLLGVTLVGTVAVVD